MNKKNLWFIYVLLISFLLYSCGSNSLQETNDISVTTTKKPKPTSTSQTNLSPTKEIQADVEFNLSTSNKVAPEDILDEISYFGGGGGGVCPGDVENKPSSLDSINIEPLTLEYLDFCGWKKNETIIVTINDPHGNVSTKKISAANEDSGRYYAEIELKFGIDEPVGVYKFTLEGASGNAEASVNVRKPDGARLFRIDETHLLLYGFKPLESVNLYYYKEEEFAGWQNYKVNQQGRLDIEIPAYTGYRHACMGLVDDFFVAVGEESGEARLLLDTCAGAHDIVMENSIIWSCGNLKTRLLISPFQKKRVAYTDGSNMRIRKNPGFDKKIVDSVPEGTEITISGGPKCIDNVTWWKISGGRNYKEGWMAEYNNEIYWLEPMRHP